MPECSCFSIHDAQRVFQSSVASITTAQHPYLVLNKGHNVEICTVREGVLHVEAKLENERTVRYAQTIPLLTKDTILFLVYTEDDALSLVTWKAEIGFENNASVEWARGNVEGDIKCSALYQLSNTPDLTSIMVAFQFSSSWIRCVCMEINMGSARSIDAVCIYAAESDLLLPGAHEGNCHSFVEKADNGGMVFLKYHQESLLLCVLIQGCDPLTGQKSAVIRALMVNSETYRIEGTLFTINCGDGETSLLLKSDDVDRVCWAVGRHRIEVLYFEGSDPQIQSVLLWETEGQPTCAAAIEKDVWMIGTSDARYYVADVAHGSWFALDVTPFTALPVSLCLLQQASTLQEGLVFVGSTHGPSLMLSTSNACTETRLVKWKQLKSRVMIDQLAPLHHLESIRDPSGDLQLVACCGEYPLGTLKKCELAYGVTFVSKAYASLPTGVRLLSLKERSEDASPSFLCLSCDHHQSSQLLSIKDALFTSVELPLFSSEGSTVLIKAVSDRQWLHVTARNVSLIDILDSQRLHWTPPGFISNASCGDGRLALSSGYSICLLEWGPRSLSFVRKKETSEQISAMEFFNIGGVEWLFVGEWLSNAIKILDSSTLQPIAETSLLQLQSRSMAILPSTAVKGTLLVGTSAGSIASMSWIFDEHRRSIDFDGGISTIQIGRTDVKMIMLNNGKLLAYCEKAAVLERHQTDGKEHISCRRLFLGRYGCQSLVWLNLEALPNAIAWTNSMGELHVGQLEYRHRLRWTTIEMEETPRKSLWHEESASLVVITDTSTSHGTRLHLVESLSLHPLTSTTIPEGHVNDMICVKLPGVDKSGIIPAENWESYVLLHISYPGDDRESQSTLYIFRIDCSSLEGEKQRKEMVIVGMVAMPTVYSFAVCYPRHSSSADVEDGDLSSSKNRMQFENRHRPSIEVDWQEGWPVLLVESVNGLAAYCIVLQTDLPDLASEIMTDSLCGDEADGQLTNQCLKTALESAVYTNVSWHRCSKPYQVTKPMSLYKDHVLWSPQNDGCAMLSTIQYNARQQKMHLVSAMVFDNVAVGDIVLQLSPVSFLVAREQQPPLLSLCTQISFSGENNVFDAASRTLTEIATVVIPDHLSRMIRGRLGLHWTAASHPDPATEEIHVILYSASGSITLCTEDLKNAMHIVGQHSCPVVFENNPAIDQLSLKFRSSL